MHTGSWRRAAWLGAVLAIVLAGCATVPAPSGAGLRANALADGRPRAYNRPYQVHGRWYAPADEPGYDRVGLASWYSYESSSGRTADGEVFDARLATAAHTTLPIPSWLEVTNLDNGRSARVRLNDRGPFVAGRLIDLSRGAAEELGFVGRGVARVRVRYLGPAPTGLDAPVRWARVTPYRGAATASVRPTYAHAAPERVLAQASAYAPTAAGPSPEEEVRQDVQAAEPTEGSAPLPYDTPIADPAARSSPGD